VRSYPLSMHPVSNIVMVVAAVAAKACCRFIWLLYQLVWKSVL
jgi:hypothetical protein